MSDSLQPHGLQYTRLPCPSPSPGVSSNSCPLSRWCYPTVSSSAARFSSCTQSFPVSGLFQGVGSLNQVAKVLELQFQHQPFQWIFRVEFLSDLLVWFPCCPRDSQASSPAPQFESINSSVLSLRMVQLSHLYVTAGKTIALTIWNFVGKVMSLFFNTLSRFVIVFLPRSNHLFISWL